MVWIMSCHHRRNPHHHRRSLAMVAEPPRDDLRASDAEREETVAALREHAGQGRLDLSELSERLDRAYESRTRAELAAVVDDFPRILPAARRESARAAERRELAGHVRAFVLVNVLLLVVWAATGAGYFWPMWPLLGWGIGVAARGRHALGPSVRRAGRHRPFSRTV